MLSAQSQSEFKRAVTVLTVTLLIAAVVVGGAYAFRANGEAKEQRARRALQKVQNNINLAKSNVDLLLEHQDDFLQLLEGGLVGDERRLSWIETLKASGLRQRIPKIRYRIDARGQAKSETLGFEEGAPLPLHVYQTRMALEMDLLHEGEVVSLLNALQAHAEGIFTVHQCDITRSAEQLSWDLSTNFRAMCDLDWFTIERPNPAEGHS